MYKVLKNYKKGPWICWNSLKRNVVQDRGPLFWTDLQSRNTVPKKDHNSFGPRYCPPPCIPALRKLDFHFLSHWVGCDRGDSFPFNSEPNGIPFGSKSNGKLSPRFYPIQCERKWKSSFLSVAQLCQTLFTPTTVSAFVYTNTSWLTISLEVSISGSGHFSRMHGD